MRCRRCATAFEHGGNRELARVSGCRIVRRERAFDAAASAPSMTSSHC